MLHRRVAKKMRDAGRPGPTSGSHSVPFRELTVQPRELLLAECGSTRCDRHVGQTDYSSDMRLPGDPCREVVQPGQVAWSQHTGPGRCLYHDENRMRVRLRELRIQDIDTLACFEAFRHGRRTGGAERKGEN